MNCPVTMLHNYSVENLGGSHYGDRVVMLMVTAHARCVCTDVISFPVNVSFIFLL